MRTNGWGLLLALAVPLSACLSVPARPGMGHTASYAVYKGAWFTVDYPVGWRVRPSLRESTDPGDSTGSIISAFFTSPDGSVEFYIFSPLWNGDPKDIALDPKRETLVYRHVERASRGKMTGGGYISNNVANWYTARAKDQSYERSWLDVEDKGLNVRHVFGIRYRDRQAYLKYQPQYARFRRSLRQFSD